MSILTEKIKSLIDELDYSDEKDVDTDRKSIEFIMNEVVDFVLAVVVPPEDTDVIYNIQKLKE